jgi:hypothetical protein
MRTSAAGTTTWVRGGFNAAAFLYLWNCYNRVQHSCTVSDGTDTWTYTSPTLRSRNNSAVSRITFVRGLNEDPVRCTCTNLFANSSQINCYAEVMLDSTSAKASGSLGIFNTVPATNKGGMAHATYNEIPGLGLHYLQGGELSEGIGTTTWYGDNGGGATGGLLSGMTFSGMF